ncbi:MAG: ribose-5-phosphate isomerase RpiA [Flavisolibacter sp.]
MNSKQLAANKALEKVKDGMTVGLGTGTTAYFAIEGLAALVRAGLHIRTVASSVASENLAREAGIAVSDFSRIDCIDLYIDGADEVDARTNLIKGGGGALTREKILSFNSEKFLVIVDESKMVQELGKFPLAVEVLPFAFPFTLSHLEQLGCKASIRKKDATNFLTDNGNFIADCQFNSIPDPSDLNRSIRGIPGVVECGLFEHHFVDMLIVGNKDGTVREIAVGY